MVHMESHVTANHLERVRLGSIPLDVTGRVSLLGCSSMWLSPLTVNQLVAA